MADRHGDPAHPELLGSRGGPAVEPHVRLARRQAFDLDLGPADAADAEPEDLGHGLLGRPPAGEVLGPVAHVAALAVGQHPAREALPEPLDGVRDPVDLDDVDAELGRPLGDDARGDHRIGRRARARHPYSTVTDFARLRGWSTSVPRATAVWYANSWSGITASAGDSASCVSATHRMSSA